MNTTIAFYGAGMLGSGFIRHLRAMGEDVRVWNRSLEKARALGETEARVFADAAEAAHGAAFVHICVRDGEAVDEVLYNRCARGCRPSRKAPGRSRISIPPRAGFYGTASGRKRARNDARIRTEISLRIAR